MSDITGYEIIGEQMRAKDTEIEGLKARVEALRQIREEDKTLITELCDALSSCKPGWPDYWKELIQRAREATR